MTYEKHTTQTDALDTLGTIIGPEAERDAIHLAVYPAVAGESLNPGADVWLDGDEAYSTQEIGAPDLVGIVDPFLIRTVAQGQRFWLVVYPRQINSLRHVWEHPGFAPSRDGNDAIEVRPTKAESEKWLREWCDQGNSWERPGFDTLMSGFEEYQDGDGYVTIRGEDAGGHIPEDVWPHVESYLDRKFNIRPEVSFSCSC